LNIPLLERLRAASGGFVSLGELGLSRLQVRDDLAALEGFGFQIECHPYLGAAYRGPAPRLCPDQIEHGLQVRWIGRRIAVWNRVSSTNDLAARAAATIANDGLVVLAEEQTAGRGQRGRSWVAPSRSSILMSILVFPPLAAPGLACAAGVPARCAWLTALAAVATAEVVSAWTGHEALIKWPNDVRVQRRKIAGILVERVLGRASGNGPADRRKPGLCRGGVVIGIGLNCELDPAGLPAELRPRVTSLASLVGGPVDRSELARTLIHRLDFWYDQVITHGTATLNAPWRARSEHVGMEVLVTTPAERLRGRLVDFDLQAGLILDAVGVSGDAASSGIPADDGSGSRRVSLESVVTLEECGDGGIAVPDRMDEDREPARRTWAGDSGDDCLGRA
jgi:BirA family biotin operon repressor/biotin-[acetyl-CoA-carboxylase] ligase